ncbi:MAG: SIMPL domain-containing protein, partial [Planctomycetota bacterium]
MSNSLPDIPHIEVSGSAEIAVEPDLARIKAELKHIADIPSEAKQIVDSQSSAVIDLARQCGVADNNINATRLEIGPEYDWRSEGNDYKGTSVSREVKITLDNLEHFPKLMQGLAEIPVHELQDVTLDTTLRGEIEREALAQAIAKAQKTAKDIATGLGQSISGVFRV